MPASRRPGRNDPCPCGSGKKFKKCCGVEPPLEGVSVQKPDPPRSPRAIASLDVPREESF